MHIFRCMGSQFCVKFQRAPLKFHTKFWTHPPQNMQFTVFNFCVWVTISLNCDVISLSETGPRASIHWANGRLTARSHEDFKPRDLGLYYSNRSVIWQAPRQQRFWDACQIALQLLKYPIVRLRDSARFGGKTSYRLVNRGPDQYQPTYFMNWPHTTDHWHIILSKQNVKPLPTPLFAYHKLDSGGTYFIKLWNNIRLPSIKRRQFKTESANWQPFFSALMCYYSYSNLEGTYDRVVRHQTCQAIMLYIVRTVSSQ